MPSNLKVRDAVGYCNQALQGYISCLPTFHRESAESNSPGCWLGYSILPIPGGRLQAENIALKRLIAVAYSVTDFQIYGNVNWLQSQRYDMDAKAPGPAALPQLRLMLRSLLEERFT